MAVFFINQGVSVMKAVANDVTVQRGGRVKFGFKENGTGIEAVILPQFSLRRCKLKRAAYLAQSINAQPRLRQGNSCEAVLKRIMGDMETRVIIAKGNLVPLDEEAATFLFGLKLPILKERHLIPI